MCQRTLHQSALLQAVESKSTTATNGEVEGSQPVSNSFGNLLLQIQTNSSGISDEVVRLDGESNEAAPPIEEDPPIEELPGLDMEAAMKELEDSMEPITDVTQSSSWETLPLDPLYKSMRDSESVNATEGTFSVARDLQQQALAVANSVVSVEQWVNFCNNGGSILPILDAIHQDAASLDEKRRMAACKAVRDLCALSPEVAAIVTDNLVRVNHAWDGGLMNDFLSILRSDSYPLQVPEDEAGNRIRLLQRDDRLLSKLYVCQLLLTMATASDDAIDAMRTCNGLDKAILSCSSFARTERTRRWLRYPGEIAKWVWRRKRGKRSRRPFLEAAKVGGGTLGNLQRTANQVLAAMGHNQWIPKVPGQRGLRILSLDGGGSRGMVAVTAVQLLMEWIGNGTEVADSFDVVAGTSTGGIIAFLTGLRQETSSQAAERYNQLIRQVFVKSALSTPLMLFTTASYDESHFMKILSKILKDDIMLDSRADPGVPLVFCVTSKMSSTPTHVALLRNYNYVRGELPDSFIIDPEKARKELGLSIENEDNLIRHGEYTKKKSTASNTSPGVRYSTESSRYPGSFRVLQRFALRASTAAPTVFKPVMMGGEIYADGGIVSSNPCAVAIHEARSLFPDVPIELVVSIGTGGFTEQKSAPRIGWDGIIGQIVNSATDGEQIHHILEDVLGDTTGALGQRRTRYFRLNPVLGPPDEFPIDVTDPNKLEQMKEITHKYMRAPEQVAKLDQIADIVNGRRWSKGFRRLFTRNHTTQP